MLNVGLIGAGILGEIHAQAVYEGDNEKLVSVCDLNGEKANAVAGKFNAAAYTDIDLMLKTETLDAVIIATPDFAHKDPVLACLKADKHVLVEKPLATNLEDAKAILQAKEGKPDLKLMVNYTNRWSPPFAKAKELIKSGKMGDPVMMSTKLNDTIWVSTEMMNWADKTTCMSFLGSHDIDLFMWMFDSDIIEVYGTGIKKVLAAKGIDTYDAMQASVVFKNKCIGSIENSWIAPNSYPIIADGKKQIYLENGFINMDTGSDQIMAYDRQKGDYPTFNVLYFEDGKVAGAFKRAHDHFIDCILSDTEPGPNVHAGYKVAQVVDAIHRSILTRKPVYL